MEKRGQMSVEYLMVVALAFILVTGVIYVVSNEIIHKTGELERSQLNKLGNSIIDTISQLSYMGGDSSLTIEEVMPSGIESVHVERGKNIIFNYTGGSGLSQIVFTSPVNVSLDMKNLTSGKKKIVISSKEDYTLVCNKIYNYSCNSICDFTKGENAETAPSDCCTETCKVCTDNKRVTSCTVDGSSPCKPECYGHNGCPIDSC